MKKTYLQPETEILYLRNMEMIALSLGKGSADDSEVLVKEDNDWDIWNSNDVEE